MHSRTSKIDEFNCFVLYCQTNSLTWSYLIIGLIFLVGKKGRLGNKIMFNVLLVYGFPFTKLPTRISFRPYKYIGKVILRYISSYVHRYGYLSTLTGGNWQKWKRVFLTCHCHEIYRDEAVGLKSCKNTWKITIFVKMWNLGQYRENLIFLSITA